MKIEIKDLRKIVKLRNEMKDKNVEFSSMEVDEDDSVNEAKRLYQMKTGGSARNGPQVESAPKKNLANKKSNDKEFKCKNCDFKTTIQSTLQRHMLKHIANLHGQEKENN